MHLKLHQYRCSDILDTCNQNFHQAKRIKHDENIPKFLSSNGPGSCKKTYFQSSPFSKKNHFCFKISYTFLSSKIRMLSKSMNVLSFSFILQIATSKSTYSGFHFFLKKSMAYSSKIKQSTHLCLSECILKFQIFLNSWSTLEVKSSSLGMYLNLTITTKKKKKKKKN